MADTTPTQQPAARSGESASVGEVVDYVKEYARQELVGPLRGAGRWIGFGLGGAACLGLGLTLVLLGVLRLLQTEWTRSATGRLSWLSYLIVFVVCIALLVVTLQQINRKFLNKEDK